MDITQEMDKSYLIAVFLDNLHEDSMDRRKLLAFLFIYLRFSF